MNTPLGAPHGRGCTCSICEPVPTLFQLMQLKAAIKLEAAGMKHSSGKSARARVCRFLKIKRTTPTQDIIDKLKDYIDARIEP